VSAPTGSATTLLELAARLPLKRRARLDPRRLLTTPQLNSEQLLQLRRVSGPGIEAPVDAASRGCWPQLYTSAEVCSEQPAVAET
jgi:hypothetical protein